MAISAAIRPRVIVTGDVTFARPFARKVDNEHLGTNLNVDTEGGPVRVTVWASTNPKAPTVGERIAFNAEVVEDRDGASLAYVSPLSADDLDLLVSFVSSK